MEDRRQALERDLGGLATQEFVGESADGLVRVTVDGRGAVCGVRVDPEQFGAIAGAELGPQVVAAARTAQQISVAEARRVLARWPGGAAWTRVADDR